MCMFSKLHDRYMLCLQLSPAYHNSSWDMLLRFQNFCLRSVLAHTRTHKHTHTQPFYGSLDFVPDNPGELVQEETFTHSHLSWSSVIPCPLPPSITIHGWSSLFSLCAWQSFPTISVQVFFGLPLGLAPSTSYSIHFFTQSLSFFHSTCPYHHNLFWCSISSNPTLCHQPFTWNSIL